MQITKQQIIDGIIKYSKNEVIPKIVDKTFKMIVIVITTMIETKPEIITKVFDNSIISSFLTENDGFYDIEILSEVLEKTLEEYGDFPVKIPGIKFISPEEKELNFTASDIKKIKSYIVGGSI